MVSPAFEFDRESRFAWSKRGAIFLVHATGTARELGSDTQPVMVSMLGLKV
jgi:hypothetical protein